MIDAALPVTPDLPRDADLRRALIDEAHARPPVPVALPALLTCIATLHEGQPAEVELAHIVSLTDASIEVSEPGFLRAKLGPALLQWERHTEFSRYTIVQPIRQSALMGADSPPLASILPVPPSWLRAIPGRTMVALQLCMLITDGESDAMAVNLARAFLGVSRVPASRIADGAARVFADFRLRPDGYTRALMLCERISEDAAGRIAAQFVELDLYRMMALQAFPVARGLGPTLASNEGQLAAIARAIRDGEREDTGLLTDLMRVATDVETLIAQHTVRFSATEAYHAIAEQRMRELAEQPIAGCVTVFTFLRRRLTPAVATVAAAAQRLAGLSERTSRSSALLRTRVDIRNETQNQELLRSLARGQKLQVRLGETVEGLSVAAISYYVVGLLGYGFKALESTPLAVDATIAMGVSIPLVVFAVWWLVRRLRARVYDEHGTPG